VVNPRVVGKPHRHFYALGATVDHPELWGPAQVLVKVSTADHSHDSATTSEVRIESLRGTLCSRRYSAAS
jgi:hypothetical protein